MQVPNSKLTASWARSVLKPHSGGITLPAETGEERMVSALARLWGADAIRDSDGTSLSDKMIGLGLDVYSTICLVRSDQTYARQHPGHLPQKYLMSNPVTAESSRVVLDLLSGFHREKYVVDTIHDPKKYWEVIDRTTGEIVPASRWKVEAKSGRIFLTGAKPFHVYTANFLVFQIWDTTSMYNHLINQWDKPHVLSVDPYHKECWNHLMKVYDRFLAEHPRTDVVRLTTLAYHFAVDSDENGRDLFRDWTGYQDTVSVPALEDFSKEYGYRLRGEDFVDQGYYNASNRVPSKSYLDWMAFIHRFVVRFGKELVRRAHRAGKRTAIFWGDHWIGVEPYQPGFLRMGLDIHIGAAEDGVALRRVSDAPGGLLKELRLYPYFFPDVFRAGGDPLGESQSNWIKIRRALMRKPVDRLGYGGYLSLAGKNPEFVRHVSGLCREFRGFCINSAGSESWKAPIKVAVLNCWGRWKAWINSFGAPQKFLVKRPDVIQVAGTNLLECLAGLPVEVNFLSFSEVEKNGIPRDVDVIINDGDPETAWSGGRWWGNPQIAAALRRFVFEGGAFIGCRGPSAYPHQGRYFQLADVMGVEKEVGNTLQFPSIDTEIAGSHFILDGLADSVDFGVSETFVFATDRKTEVLAGNGRHVHMAARGYGCGRSVFFAALPYSLANARILHRAIFWAARKEKAMRRWYCENPNMEVAFYPATGKRVVVNNVGSLQRTLVYDGKGSAATVSIKGFGSNWSVPSRSERRKVIDSKMKCNTKR